jgi:hypothetical protein
MTMEFRIEWVGFPSNETRRLKARWARCRFPTEFCGRFSGRAYRGVPGEPGGICIQANDGIPTYAYAELAFSSLDELVTMAEGFVRQAAQRCHELASPTVGVH